MTRKDDFELRAQLRRDLDAKQAEHNKALAEDNAAKAGASTVTTSRVLDFAQEIVRLRRAIERLETKMAKEDE